MAKKQKPTDEVNEQLVRMIKNLVQTGLRQGVTGRHIVVYRPGEGERGIKQMKDSAGVSTVRSLELQGSSLSTSEAVDKQIYYENLDMAVTTLPPDALRDMSLSSADSAVQAIVPERVYFLESEPMFGQGADFPAPGVAMPGMAMPGMGMPVMGMPGLEYWMGYRDGISTMIDRMAGGGIAGVPMQSMVAFQPAVPQMPVFSASQAAPIPRGMQARGLEDAASANDITWGLKACNVDISGFSGKGIKIAVIDSGLDLHHVDFQGRSITGQSFVGEPVQDGFGHGTHCAGTACGPKVSHGGIRYGIAFDSEIFIAKGFLNDGTTVGAALLDGLNWAVGHGCHVVSMSFGAPPSAFPEPHWEAAINRAVRAGTAVVAAAGNRSQRPARILPVDSPADCTFAMGVGAIDRNAQVAYFSNAGMTLPAGAVDVAGPGVDVYSSLPGSTWGRKNGTSQATPHAAGVLALLFEKHGANTSALQLMKILRQTARVLPGLPERDVGSGLVQAP